MLDNIDPQVIEKMKKLVGTYECEPGDLCDVVSLEISIVGSKLCLTIMEMGKERFTEEELDKLQFTIMSYKEITRTLELGVDEAFNQFKNEVD